MCSHPQQRYVYNETTYHVLMHADKCTDNLQQLEFRTTRMKGLQQGQSLLYRPVKSGHTSPANLDHTALVLQRETEDIGVQEKAGVVTSKGPWCSRCPHEQSVTQLHEGITGRGLCRRRREQQCICGTPRMQLLQQLPSRHAPQHLTPYILHAISRSWVMVQGKSDPAPGMASTFEEVRY